MKNIIKLSGIIVLVAIIGFSFVACSNGSTDDPATGLTGTFTRTVDGKDDPNGVNAVYEITVTGTAARDCVCTITAGDDSYTGDVPAGATAVEVAESIVSILEPEWANLTFTRTESTITITANFKTDSVNFDTSISFK